MTYKPSKLGENDLVFGLQSEFIMRSVYAELQVSKCSGYDAVSGNGHRRFQTHTETAFDRLYY